MRCDKRIPLRRIDLGHCVAAVGRTSGVAVGGVTARDGSNGGVMLGIAVISAALNGVAVSVGGSGVQEGPPGVMVGGLVMTTNVGVSVEVGVVFVVSAGVRVRVAFAVADGVQVGGSVCGTNGVSVGPPGVIEG